MKKAVRLLYLVLIAAIFLCFLAVGAQATELKTGVGYVDASGLRLRASTSTDSEVLSTASYGDTVVVIRQVDDWYLVDYNLDVGYMAAEYVQFKAVENAELGNGQANSTVNIRSKPSSDGSLVLSLAEGEKANIIGINNGWYKVTYGSEVGYVRSDLLTLTEVPHGNSSGGGSVSSVSSQLISYAQNYLGTRYVWGGTTPSGFDCSGFTRYVYAAFGYSLNRTAANQLGNGTSVSKSSLAVGDLVFFANTYSSSAAATHVGIYVGNGQFIHAASGGVKITNLSDSFYASRYVGARRIL
ncbi:MAG: SH3 domain-containing C40 family peptidase [Oscillospiraceae bacterium]|nr:SH3 domain-containing C40 family peptidase [Oscillospiraceae bacterium]